MEKSGICASKKFLSQDVCMPKFLFFEGIQGHISTIIHQSFTILAGSGTEVEIFYSQKLGKNGFWDSKKFFTLLHCMLKFLFFEGI